MNQRHAWLLRLLTMFFAAAVGADAVAADVHPRVLAAAASEGSADAILVFADQGRPALAPLQAGADYRVRRRALIDALRARADSEQAGVRAWLDARAIAHRDYWIANLIQARIPRAALASLSARADIARIDPNPQIAMNLPRAERAANAPADVTTDPAAGIAWGVAKIDAPAVWAAGADGQGVVIGGEDTGYQWDHPALKPQYRGWNGSTANHNFNWHDAVHDAPTEPVCGNNSLVPCDPDNHGTHTAGTFAGDDGPDASPRHQIGVAPGARWIGCRNMDKDGSGTPTRYVECMQWMLQPTDLAGANPSPDLAPDIVSNSWYCAVSEGCTVGNEIQGAVENLVAAGIFYAAAAGNNGGNVNQAGNHCGTIAGPPATYDASFVVGATDSGDALAWFSSRGPAMDNESPPQILSLKFRPDVSAPGVNVCSSIPTSIYSCTFSGTSMATPHVAGAAALLISAFPALKGRPEEVAAILQATAIRQGIVDPVANEVCQGYTATQWPNYLIGYGRVDAWAAFHEVVFIDDFGR